MAHDDMDPDLAIDDVADKIRNAEGQLREFQRLGVFHRACPACECPHTAIVDCDCWCHDREEGWRVWRDRVDAARRSERLSMKRAVAVVAQNERLTSIAREALENLRLTRQLDSLPERKQALVIAEGYSIFERAHEALRDDCDPIESAVDRISNHLPDEFVASITLPWDGDELPLDEWLGHAVASAFSSEAWDRRSRERDYEEHAKAAGHDAEELEDGLPGL